MRAFFLRLLDAPSGEAEITVFSRYHAAYLLVIAAMIIVGVRWMRRGSPHRRQCAVRAAAWAVPLIYAADFFLMPLSSAQYAIDVGKLPFHICTLMGLLIPFAQFHHHGARFADAVAALSLVSAACFLIFPGSAVGNGRHPLSYAVVQTFAYHGAMLLWSVWTLSTRAVTLRLRGVWKPALLLMGITLWAGLANVVYSHEAAQFDWLFVTGRSVPFLPSWSLLLIVPSLLFTGTVAVYAVMQLMDSKDLSK